MSFWNSVRQMSDWLETEAETNTLKVVGGAFVAVAIVFGVTLI